MRCERFPVPWRPFPHSKQTSPQRSRRHRHFAIALLLTLLCLGSAALAQKTIHIPADQPTIQAGINAANNSDTVLIAPGTYYENIDFKGKAITVTSSGGVSTVTINGGKKAATVVFTTGEDGKSVISNLTITGGGSDYHTSQGGIFISESSPTILNNIITRTSCYGINSQASAPLIQGNEISFVSGQCDGFGVGAGIFLYLSGFYVVPTVIRGNTIEFNTESGLADAGGNGGAGIAIANTLVVIDNNIIRYNATGRYSSAAGGGQGGAIFFDGGGGLVVDNLIYGNTSNLQGGGIAYYGFGSHPLTILNNTIVDNAVVPVTTFSQQVLGGEQLYFDNANDGLNVIFANNIVSGSTSAPTMVCKDNAAHPFVYQNNDFFNANGPVTGTVPQINCKFPSGTSGNISADPTFVSPANLNYRLLINSPGVDSGSNGALQLAAPFGLTITTDLDDQPRLQDATQKGYPVVDVGAYEYSSTASGTQTLTSIVSSLNPATYGQSVTFAATVTDTLSTSPSGSIVFSEGTTILSTQLLNPNGVASATASFTSSTLSASTHPITATYVPSSGFLGSTASLMQTILAQSSATTLAASPNPAYVGQAVTLSANVSGLVGIPTGKLTFYDGTVALSTVTLDSSGHASFATSTLAAGSHLLLSVYSGDIVYFGGKSLGFTEDILPLPQDFTITLASPTVTIQTQHHLTTTVTVTSLNGFADSIALGCVNPPQYITCRFTPSSAPLTANGSATVSLYLDTDSVLGYARLRPPAGSRPPSPICLALLLSPFGIFVFAARSLRRRSHLRLLLLLLAALPVATALTGCGSLIYPYEIPASATPGIYTVPIAASGATTGITHVANLTLQITP